MKEISDITRRSHRFWDNLRISTAAGIGLLLSLAACYSVWRWEDRVTKQEFNALAESDILTLQNGLNLYLSKLAALRALFESSADVSRNEFEMFTGRLLLHQSAIQNFSWVPRVMRAERAAHESAAAHDGIADYRIKSVAPDNNIVPSEDREEYLPIFYSSVTSRKSPIYGIDLRSQPLIERPLDRARDQDQLSAVPDFVLHSATGNKHGFLFSLPVYRQGLPHDTVEDRRRNLVGFVHGAFLTAEAFGNIIDTSTTAHPVDLYLFIADAGSAAPPLYVYSSRLRTEPAEQKSEAALDAGPHWSGELKAGEARWSLMVVPIPGGRWAPATVKPGSFWPPACWSAAWCWQTCRLRVAMLGASKRSRRRIRSRPSPTDVASSHDLPWPSPMRGAAEVHSASFISISTISRTSTIRSVMRLATLSCDRSWSD
jgi:CHASE1-domain containing sensor protein